MNTRDDSLFSSKAAKWKSEAMLDHKCIVIVTGFYEPRKVGKESYPYVLHRSDFEVFGLCGYYTKQENGLTFSMLTIQANAFMGKIHNAAKRMPMTLHPDEKEKYFELNNEDALQEEFSKKYCIPLDYKPAHRSVLNTRIDSNHKGVIEAIFHPILTDF